MIGGVKRYLREINLAMKVLEICRNNKFFIA